MDPKTYNHILIIFDPKTYNILSVMDPKTLHETGAPYGTPHPLARPARPFNRSSPGGKGLGFRGGQQSNSAPKVSQ